MSVKEAAVMEVEVQNINGFKVHASHTCDGCNVSPIVGKRFKSSDTANFDLCSKCFAAYDGDELFEETLLGESKISLLIMCHVMPSSLNSIDPLPSCIPQPATGRAPRIMC